MIEEKAKKIKIVIFDVDGVLTDGSIIFGNFNDEYRVFNVHDGLGIILLHAAGIKSAIITSKSTKDILKRAKELKIDMVYKNVQNKLTAFHKILKKLRLKPEETCFVGDDWLDVAVLKATGLAVTVPDAPQEIKEMVDYVTKKNAGKGAVREIIELILKAQDKWHFLIKRFSG